MIKDLPITNMNNEDKNENNRYDGFKIIEVNVSSSSETLYAVCTPVKIKE